MNFTSSPHTTLYKYYLLGFPFVLTIGMLGLVSLETNIDYNFYYGFGILILLNTIFSIRAFFSLKTITLDDQGIVVHSSTTGKTIPYKSVQSVHFFHTVNPSGVTIEYLDEAQGEVNKISYVVNPAYARPLKKDQMAVTLVEKAKQHNPNYQESSVFRNLLFLLVLASPFLLGVIYFMAESQTFGVL